MWKQILAVVLFFALFFAIRSYMSYKNHKSNAQIEQELKMAQDNLAANIITPKDIEQQHQKQATKQAAIKDKTLWDKLIAVRYEVKTDGYIPFFDDRQLDLEQKEVVLEGYLIQTEVNTASNYLLLSLYPYQSCFFCGEAGIETLVEIEATKPITYTDKPVKIKGILQLNRKIDAAFFYTIKNAMLVFNN
jgi:hypothetical protein